MSGDKYRFPRPTKYKLVLVALNAASANSMPFDPPSAKEFGPKTSPRVHVFRRWADHLPPKHRS